MNQKKNLLAVKIGVLDRELLTVNQVAELMGCTEKTVRNWIKFGRLKKYELTTIGGKKRIWIDKSELVRPEEEQ